MASFRQTVHITDYVSDSSSGGLGEEGLQEAEARGGAASRRGTQNGIVEDHEDDEIIELTHEMPNNAAREQNNDAGSPVNEDFTRFRGALENWLEMGKIMIEAIENIGEDEIQMSSNDNNNANRGTIYAGKDFNRYLPLYRAAQRDDWEEVKKLLEENEEGAKSIINRFRETTLQVAVETGKSNNVVRKLLEYPMPHEALLWKNIGGDTALHLGAVVGNLEAVTMLVDRNPDLLYILNNKKFLAVHLAAMGCHKETLVYLISKSQEGVENSPFEGQSGAVLLMGVISSEFMDVALELVQNHPLMATLKDKDGDYALHTLSGTNCVFPSGESFNWWQKWIYKRITVTLPKPRKLFTGDVENQSLDDNQTNSTKLISWLEFACRVPFVKSIKDKKVMHKQALELVRCLCKSLEALPHNEALLLHQIAILQAADGGIHEVLEIITEIFPSAIHARNPKDDCNIFLVAARNRYENVFNLIYQMNGHKHFFYDSKDSSGNNFMHMCAELAPPHKLNLVSGAALQMQRELQWFKEMEKFVNPSRRSWVNKEKKTPKMLFTEKHQELKLQGEKWMKDTATSCTIAAALIATVVFAAAFTVPGGVDSGTGVPVFLNRTSFIIFAISDSVSLFTSITSLLMFLSILTSRYAEEDFLYVLPQRLCIGLLTLFTSITFMMVAFSTAIYLTLHEKSRLFLVPVAALACLPVASFMFLQFPLLIDVMYSTYGPGIFGKQSDRPLS